MSDAPQIEGRTEEDDLEDSAAPLIEHLAELRTRLLYAIGAFVVCVFAVFYVWQPIFDFLVIPICSALEERGQSCNLILVRLEEGFFTAIRISLLGGFALAFPFMGFQLWRFVAPGLYKSEKNAFLPFLFASPVMFFIGAAFTYYIVMPLAFDFFLMFQQVSDTGEEVVDGTTINQGALEITFTGSMASYLSLTITFIMAFGLCFQLPVLLTLLGKAGLVSAKGLAAVRKYAVVAILVLAGLVTPPDIITQVILFVAVYGLYEISIWLVRGVERRRIQKLKAEGLWDEDLYGDLEDDLDDDPEDDEAKR